MKWQGPEQVPLFGQIVQIRTLFFQLIRTFSKISVDNVAKTFAMRSRNFIRRFKKATMNTPSVYIQRLKVEAAKKSFESFTENVNEVIFNIGYSDTKAFRDIFKKYTGLSPNDYKKKYNRVNV